MVSGSGKIPEGIPPVQRTPQPQAKPVKSDKAPESDQVILSPRAVQAQTLASKVDRTPEVRPEKVAEAQAQAAVQAPLAPAAKVAEKLLLGG